MVDYRNILRLQSQGHSQREIERELYCSRHTISEVLIRAKSAGIASGARTENRPAYQRMLEDCRNKNLDLIVCKSISRFGRNTEDMLISLREIKACGVNVFFQLENINTSEASSDTNPALKSIQNRKRMV